MWQQQVYISEKLKEAEASRRGRTPAPPPDEPPGRPRRRVLGPVARAAGRRVRRIGEALESWATPQTAAR